MGRASASPAVPATKKNAPARGLSTLSTHLFVISRQPVPAERPQQHPSDGAYSAFSSSFFRVLADRWRPHANLLKTLFPLFPRCKAERTNRPRLLSQMRGPFKPSVGLSGVVQDSPASNKCRNSRTSPKARSSARDDKGEGGASIEICCWSREPQVPPLRSPGFPGSLPRISC